MPLSPGLRRLYSGDHNLVHQDWQDDGSVIVTIAGGRLPFAHRLHVRDLYGPDEEVLSEEVIPPGPPAHIQARLDQARRFP